MTDILIGLGAGVFMAGLFALTMRRARLEALEAGKKIARSFERDTHYMVEAYKREAHEDTFRRRP